MEYFVDFIQSVPFYLSILCAVLYLIRYRNKDKPYTYFTWYLVCMAAVELSMVLYIDLGLGDTNLFLFVYYLVAQFVCLSLFFYSLLKQNWIRWMLLLVLGLLLIQYVLEPSLYFKYNPLGTLITQLVLVFYSLFYFYDSLSGKGRFTIVNYGIFLYLLSSILIFASGNLVFNDLVPEIISHHLQDLNLVLYFVFQIFIIFEWVKHYSGWFKKPN